MVYRVQDPGLLKAVKAGDKVKFDADRVNNQFTVTKFRRLSRRLVPGSLPPTLSRACDPGVYTLANVGRAQSDFISARPLQRRPGYSIYHPYGWCMDGKNDRQGT